MVDPLEQGFTLLAQGQIDAALAVADAALAQDAQQSSAWLLRAHVLAGRGDLANAATALNRGAELEPDSAVFPFNIGQILLHAGQTDAGIDALKTALAKPVITAEIATECSELIGRHNARPSSKTFKRHLKYLDASERFPVPFAGFAGKPNSISPDGRPFDALGFVNAITPPVPKPDGEVRILVLGDSTMCKPGPPHLTVPGRVEAVLHGRGLVDVKAYNFAVVSNRATQMLAQLLFQVVDHQPDLVIMVMGGAEVYVPKTYDPRPGYPYNFYVIEELYSRVFDVTKPDFSQGSLAIDELIDGMAARQEALRAQFQSGDPEAWELQNVENVKSCLAKVARLAQAFELPVAVVLQPLATTKATATHAERNMNAPETTAYFRRQYDRFRRGPFAERGSDAWLTTHDATAAFDETSQDTFTDFIHYNESGDTLMARYLADVAEECLQKK